MFLLNSALVKNPYIYAHRLTWWQSILNFFAMLPIGTTPSRLRTPRGTRLNAAEKKRSGANLAVVRVLRAVFPLTLIGYAAFVARYSVFGKGSAVEQSPSDGRESKSRSIDGSPSIPLVRRRESLKKKKRILSRLKSAKEWERTKFTLDDFVVGGINLAEYKMGEEGKFDPKRVKLEDRNKNQDPGVGALPFELYEDFDMADLVTGDEGWWDLVGYRREMERPSLSFYVDKVAQKRWLPRVKGLGIPMPLVLKYGHELELPGGEDVEKEGRAIRKLLPTDRSYAAKPTHKSCSSGVWLVSQRDGRTPRVSRGGHHLEHDNDFEGGGRIALSLAENLHKKGASFESRALLRVKAGILIEERYVGLESSKSKYRPAIEFKVFTIWGRVWLANWRCGSSRWGLVYRDGAVVDWSSKKEDHEEVPGWVPWDTVIGIAEDLGQQKDMYRTDIFVGLDADDPTLLDDRSDEDRRKAVKVVVSETEMHPTTKLHDPGLFEEAARLWISGYKMGIYKVVPNDEVPKAFLDKGWLSEEDLETLSVMKENVA